MTGIARILSESGFIVHGSDTDEPQITDRALANIVDKIHPLNAPLPTNISQVIYAAAHGGKGSLQVQEAMQKGVPVLHQAEWIAQYITGYRMSIAVCGCHGKTGTSALLAYALDQLGAKPSWLVGTSEFAGRFGGHASERKDIFVFEADEYALAPPYDLTPKISLYSPTHILCTNIDFDHPDVYRNIEHTKAVFQSFFKKAQWVYECNSTTIEGNKKGIMATLRELGYTTNAITHAMMGYGGAKRRLEYYGLHDGIEYFDDYAHHPAEIATTLSELRSRYPTQRLLLLFQSHTYSRTTALKNEFVDALSTADRVYIDQIFPSARENPNVGKITSHDLELIARAKKYMHIRGFESRGDLLDQVKQDRKSGDVILTLGAGSIYKLHAELHP
jgi:UDP-N-acetylmuramate--alanine ligase